MMKKYPALLLAATLCLFLAACGDDEPAAPSEPEVPGTPATPGDDRVDDGDIPSVDPAIAPWNGTTASDISVDRPGSDPEVYWEANTFDKTVTVDFNGATAAVDNPSSLIKVHQNGTYVTLDLKTSNVAGVEVKVKGSTIDGALKVYAKQPVKVSFASASITSKTGPAVNLQCKKAVFVCLEGTTTLEDASTYSTDDCYFVGSATAATEDRKGCFFSEGNLTVSGAGVLQLTGRYRNGLAVDGAFTVRPGATIVVNDACNNGISIKGDITSRRGIDILGGLVYAYTSADAGKAMKCDLGINIASGVLDLYTSGHAVADDVNDDTSSPACLKSDEITIRGGKLTLKSTGDGGKGLNCGGNLSLEGADITVVTSGARFTSGKLTAAPKAVKADKDITIGSGKLVAVVLGRADGGEAIEAKGTIEVKGGDITAYALDDAINAEVAYRQSGGKVYARSSANDGIDSNGQVGITGGYLLAVGAASPESGLDCEKSTLFVIDGGTVISLGGSLQSLPSAESRQCSVVKTSLPVVKNGTVKIADGATTVAEFTAPRSFTASTLLVSAQAIRTGSSLTLTSAGTDYPISVTSKITVD